jgi:hypothetical protein
LAVFDDPDLVSCGGLVPVMALAERVGLPELIGERLTVAGSAGAHADAKVMSIVAGMVAGADSIDDLDLLRHGGMGVLFTDTRAPSTLGTFCGRSGSVTSVSSTPSPPGSRPAWPG